MAERWQDYERKYLRQATKDTEVEIIARKLERSESAVIREARRLKLRRIGGTSALSKQETAASKMAESN